MALRTRKPTGAVPWPLVLIEGSEKTGKSWSGAVLTASDKVGRCFWIDLGEGAADEYGAIPGADYEIVEHDGSFSDLYGAVAEIRDLAAAALKDGAKPVVLVIDSMTAEWDLLKDWASDRAKSSKFNRNKLAQDPHAEIRVSQNYWNDANARHRKLMRLLMTFPGIVVMTARGKEVAAVGDDGQPVEGKKEYRVEAQKTLGSDASVWVRLSRSHGPAVVGARSVHSGIRPGIDEPKTLPDDWSLEWLIFDALKCDPAKAHVRDLTEPKSDVVTPEHIRDEALAKDTGFARIRELYAEAERLGYDDVTIHDERGAEELLLTLLKRLGDAKRPAPKQGTGEQQQAHQAKPETAPEQPAEAAWDLDQALAAAPVAKDRDECVKLWHQSATAVRAGQCSTADAERIQALLTARMDDLKNAEQPPAALDPEDPWAVRVEEIQTASDAEMAMNELLEAFKGGRIDETRANTIRNAISARAAQVADVLEGQVAA